VGHHRRRLNDASDRTGYGTKVAHAKREPLSFCEGNTQVYIPLGPGSDAFRPTGGPPSGPCYVRAAVPSRGLKLRGATAATAAVALALAGCGGSDAPTAEQSATYSVAIPHRSFPARQSLAEHVQLRLVVRNEGARTIPNVAATLETGSGADGAAVEAFGSRLDEAGLASRSRPVWIVDDGPVSGDTAYANTWALGSIRPHDKRSFTWRVVPVRPGRYTLRYRLTGSTTGRSQLRLADGDAARGSFTVHVSGKPAEVRVTPDGRIVSVPQ
jgi:hypothetical protein